MRPMLSILITNYNKEEYIKKCLNSLPLHDDSFEIIIIDDYSDDTSKEFLKNIVDDKLYSNLKVIFNDENLGVSSCRNIGLELCTGHYVTFLDADDYLEIKNISTLLFKLNKTEEYALIIGNINSFNNETNWKSISMREIFPDTSEGVKSYQKNPELHLTPSVCNKIFLKKIIDEYSIRFDKNQHIGEDLLFVQTYIQYVDQVYTTSETFLNYRVLEKGKSLSRKRDLLYFEQLVKLEEKLKVVYKLIPENSIHVEQRQFTFMINVFEDILFSIKEEEINDFAKLLLRLPRVFYNFNILIKNEKIKIPTIMRILHKLSEEDLIKLLNFLKVNKDDIWISDDGKILSSLAKVVPYLKEELKIKELKSLSKIESFNMDNEKMEIKGYFGIENLPYKYVKKRFLVIEHENGEITKILLANDYRTDLSYVYSKNKIDYSFYGFKKIELPIKTILLKHKMNSFFFEAVLSNGEILSVPLNIFGAEMRNSFRSIEIEGNFLIPNYNNGLIITNNKTNFQQRMTLKIKTLKNITGHIVKMMKEEDWKTITLLILNGIWRFVGIEKKIWLIAERKNTAQDNSYYLFKYIREKHKDIPVYYVIDKKSKDYQKVRELGNVIAFDSLRHSLALLNSKVTINSYLEAPNMYTASFKKIAKIFPKWVKRKKVFLQHGVIGFSRLNHVLHKNRANYNLFLTSNEMEKNHIVNEYGYDTSEVPVTGLVRWDSLKDQSMNTAKKQILIMPTWRHWITSTEEFINSDFWIFYSKLMSDASMIQLLEKENAEITFFPHYLMRDKMGEVRNHAVFNHNSVNIAESDSDIREYLEGCDILITDYSSVAYDVNYLNKPVIFCPFDYEKFYSEHYNQGPVLPGEEFGSVAKDVNSVILATDSALKAKREMLKARESLKQINSDMISKIVFERIKNL